MTMRLDIVTNDAGELVRREHARELGAGVVVAIYRLAKLAQMHDLANQAFTRQLEQTHQIIGEYCLRSGSNVSILFAHKAVFVAGQLLKGSRGAYEAATELGEIFERLGGSELYVQRDVTREELLAFAEQISIGYRSAAGSFRSPTPKIRLRVVADAARLRGIELEDLTPDQRIVRTYASAVVIMRRFFEDLAASRYILPRRIKRIAQSLVDLSEGQTAAFLGVTEVRNANFDEAGRAVNTAILSVLMAREATEDRAVLSQVAMAAMMHDVARPRAMALAAAGGPAIPGMAGPTSLSEDQEDRLAAGAAAVLTALGRVNEPSIVRTVLTFEALWLRRQTWLGPVYWGARPPTLHSNIIAIARRYNDLLTPEPGLPPPSPDYAVAKLAEELREPQDRTVLRMLVSALGLLPVGTLVQLNTGELAEVVRGARSSVDKPRIALLRDQNGAPLQQPIEIELSQDLRRQVARVVSVDGWRKGLELAGGADGAPPDPDFQSEPPPPAPVAAMPPPSGNMAPISPLSPMPMPKAQAAAAPVAARSIADQYADQYASWGGGEERPRRDSSSSIGSGQSGEHHSSQSLPSMGSSPSAVAEAMGRMINDSLRPPAVAPRDNDKTLFQRSGPDELAERVTSRPAGGAREPTARGNLAATPLPHVLVYMLDHALTGTVVFEGGSNEDAIHFVEGTPTKIRLAEPVALLGELLVGAGALDAKTLEHAVDGARRLGILLGEYLVGHDLVSREALAWAVEAQLLSRIAFLANLSPEITYAYYRDVDLLEGWGGGDVTVSATLNPILASVRNWADRARVRATLNRIGKHPLVLHDEADVANLALTPEEQATLDVIRSENLPLAQLFKRNIADEEIVSSLVYALAVTRQFAFKGQKKGPMRRSPRASAAPRSGAPLSGSASPPSRPASSAQSGARQQPGVSPSMAAAAGAPTDAPPRRVSAAKMPVASPSSGARAPADARGPASAGRIPAPAARPAAGGGGRGAPQIRPITAKKATMVGLQAAAPVESRQPASMQRPPQAASPTPSGARELPSSTPPDGMKTIAMPPSKLAPRARAAMPRPGPPLPSASRAPAAPERPTSPVPPPVQQPRSGTPAGPSSPRVASARPARAPTPAATPAVRPAETARPSASAVKTAPPKPDSTDEIEIDVDDSAPNGPGAFDLSDEGMADAELAIEAMQNFRLAEAALQRNDTATAQKLAQKAVDGDPMQADYLTLLAWIRALGGNPAAMDEAIGIMNEVLTDDPSNERALLYRGKLFVRTNRFQEALADFNELLGSNPHHREAATEVRLLKQRMS